MCVCCCPPAVSALFCLWVKSGFSKESVAGALTFFPPEPAFYKFHRLTKDGELLPDYEDEDDECSHSSDEENVRRQQIEEVLDEDDERYDSRHGDSKDDKKENKEAGGKATRDPRFASMTTGIKPSTDKKKDEKKKKEEKMQNELNAEPENPAAFLTEKSARLRHLAKIKNARDAKDAKMEISYQLEVDSRLQNPHMPRFSGTVESVKIGPQPKTSNYIAAVLYRLKPERTTEKTKTIIYSHGNATDVGAMNLMQCLMAKGLKANILMYDYSGYGASGGVPLEANTYRDIKLVYQWVVDNVVKDESQIVVYGQSVGSGPSCYICKKRPNVGGLILHSPFMSGMRVLTPSRALACLDIFPNIDRIKHVQCKVMVIHGALDEEVDIAHGYALHQAVPADLRAEPWWVPDRGHNDITEGTGKLNEYIRRLKAFTDGLDS